MKTYADNLIEYDDYKTVDNLVELVNSFHFTVIIIVCF